MFGSFVWILKKFKTYPKTHLITLVISKTDQVINVRYDKIVKGVPACNVSSVVIFFKCNQIASNDHQYSVNFTITFKAQNTLTQNVHRRLEILGFHKSVSLAPKIYSTLSIYLKKYFYVALVRTSSFHKWLSYWYLHNKSTKGSQKSQLVISLLVPCRFMRQNYQ